jgi:hypothetical protein
LDNIELNPNEILLWSCSFLEISYSLVVNILFTYVMQYIVYMKCLIVYPYISYDPLVDVMFVLLMFYTFSYIVVVACSHWLYIMCKRENTKCKCNYQTDWIQLHDNYIPIQSYFGFGCYNTGLGIQMVAYKANVFLGCSHVCSKLQSSKVLEN